MNVRSKSIYRVWLLTDDYPKSRFKQYFSNKIQIHKVSNQNKDNINIEE